MSTFADRSRGRSSGNHSQTLPGFAPPPAAGAVIERLVTAFWLWHDRARQRRLLLALNDHALQDIGIGRAEAAGEGDKPFWRS